MTVTAFVVEHACGAPPFALSFLCDGKVLAYTGDTEWTESLIAVGRDADLLIAEALFFDHKIKYHLDYATLKANLGRIGARRVSSPTWDPICWRASERRQRKSPRTV